SWFRSADATTGRARAAAMNSNTRIFPFRIHPHARGSAGTAHGRSGSLTQAWRARCGRSSHLRRRPATVQFPARGKAGRRAMFQNFEAGGGSAESATRVAALRRALSEAGVTGFLVPRADAHQGETV